MDRLPIELLEEIFSYLRWTDHSNIGSVCRLWHSIASHDRFRIFRYFTASDPLPVFGCGMSHTPLLHSENWPLYPGMLKYSRYSDDVTKVGVHYLLTGYSHLSVEIQGYDPSLTRSSVDELHTTDCLDPSNAYVNQVWCENHYDRALQYTGQMSTNHTECLFAASYDENNGWEHEGHPHYFDRRELETGQEPADILLYDPIVSPLLSDEEAMKVLENIHFSVPKNVVYSSPESKQVYPEVEYGLPEYFRITVFSAIQELIKTRPSIGDLMLCLAQCLMIEHFGQYSKGQTRFPGDKELFARHKYRRYKRLNRYKSMRKTYELQRELGHQQGKLNWGSTEQENYQARVKHYGSLLRWSKPDRTRGFLRATQTEPRGFMLEIWGLRPENLTTDWT